MKTLRETMDEAARGYLIFLLFETAGDVTRAAQIAGRNRTEFYATLKRHRVDLEGIREALP